MAVFDVSTQRLGAFTGIFASMDIGDEIIYSVGAFCKGPHKFQAMKAFDGGFCVLYQRRVSKGVFQYTAKKTKAMK